MRSVPRSMQQAQPARPGSQASSNIQQMHMRAAGFVFQTVLLELGIRQQDIPAYLRVAQLLEAAGLGMMASDLVVLAIRNKAEVIAICDSVYISFIEEDGSVAASFSISEAAEAQPPAKPEISSTINIGEILRRHLDNLEAEHNAQEA